MSLKIERVLGGSAVVEMVAPPALAKIGRFVAKQDWLVGKSADGKWDIEIKAFDEPSYYGINGGQVSKLSIRAAGVPKDVVNYDRGWDVKPKDAAMKALVLSILSAFPKHVEPADREPENAFEARVTLASVLNEAGLSNFGGKKAKPFTKEDEAAQDDLEKKHGMSYEEWEGEVRDELENLLDMTTSDAQGLLATSKADAALGQCWRQGLDPKAAARKVDAATVVKESAADPVAHWVPVTDKIMKHRYFAVSGKLADAKIACAWRGNGEGYAVVDPSDVEKAKAIVKGMGSKEEGLRLAAVLNEEDMTPGIGAKMGRPDLGAYGKDAAKYFRKRKAECGDGAGKGKSAVRGLRAAIRSAEEAMTPDIGKKMGRPDLGAYGQRKREGVEVMSVADYKRRWMSGHENSEVKKAEREGKDLRVTVQHSPFGSFAVGMEAVPKGTKADEQLGPNALKAATPAIGRQMRKAVVGDKEEAAAPEMRLSKSTVVQMFAGDDARHVLGSKTGVATDKSGANWEFNAVGDKWDLRKVESRRRPGARLANEIAATEDMLMKQGPNSKLKRAADALPRRDKEGRLLLVGEAAKELWYIGVRRNPQLSKPYYVAYGPLSASAAKEKEGSLYGSMTLTDYPSKEEYDAKIKELEAGGFRVNKRVGEAELPSAEEYAALVHKFMKDRNPAAFDDKAWQEAVDAKGVGVPMHLWSKVKGLVKGLFSEGK